jgi:hypothetical protein
MIAAETHWRNSECRKPSAPEVPDGKQLQRIRTEGLLKMPVKVEDL